MEQNRYTQMRNDEPDKDEESLDGSDVYSVYTHKPVEAEYNIYLSESIQNNFKYTELLHALRHFKDTDKVKLYLANYGGLCSTGFQIANAIKDCKARVEVVVDAPCYSMGAILAVCGDSLKMNPGTFLMFHNYSGFEIGKGLEMKDAINHYFAHFHKHLKVLCYPFLTAKELAALEKDNDVYVSSDDKDLKERIKRHFK